MSNAARSFEQRVSALRDTHKKMANGYTQKLDKNGTVTFRPKKTISLRPLRYVFMMALVLVVFKSAVLVTYGTEAYLDKLTPFQIGSFSERFGAWLMQIDPITARIAEVWTVFSA